MGDIHAPPPSYSSVIPHRPLGKPWYPVRPPPPRLDDWQTRPWTSCFTDPWAYIIACFCTPCYTYSQRKRILQGNWNDYVCCNGVCYGNKMPWQKKIPRTCMVFESLCCINCAIHGHRVYMLNKYYLKDSLFELCLLHCCSGTRSFNTNIPLQSCCAVIFGNLLALFVPGVPQEIENYQDIPICYDPVSACFLAQMVGIIMNWSSLTEHRDEYETLSRRFYVTCTSHDE